MRNLFSILIIIVLVAITPALFVITSVKHSFTTSRFIKHELVTRNAYGIAVNQVSEQLGKIKLDKEVPITSADLQVLGAKVITPAWLQQNVETTLDTIFAWFNDSTTSQLSLPIDLRQPKTALAQGIDDLLTAKIPTLPTCPKSGKSDSLCKTSTTTLASLKEQLKKNDLDIEKIKSQLPDTIDLAHPVLPAVEVGKKDEPQPTQQYDQQQHPITSTATNQQPQEQKLAPAEQAQKVVDQLNKAKKNYQQGLQGYMALVAMYVVLVLGYIAINAFNGWSRLTRWIGILAVSIGVLPFMIAAGTRTAVEQAILNMHFDSGVPMAIQQAAPLAARDVQHVLFFSMTIISGLIVLLGIAAIIWAHFMAKPEVKKK